jgi:hypothetical protein
MTTTTANTFLTFLATFLGVLASFLLWFWGEHIIQRSKDKKASKAVLQEVEKEIYFSIESLTTQEKQLTEIIEKKLIPNVIIQLKCSASSYAISSGEIRTLNNREKEQAVREANALCEYFNDFAKSADIYVSIQSGSIQNQSYLNYLPLKEKLSDFIRLIQNTRSMFQSYIEKLKKQDLPEDEENAMTTISSKEPVIKETQLDRIEKGLSQIVEQLNGTKRLANAQFITTIGIACISIAIAFWAASISDNSQGYAITAAIILYAGFVILSTANWYYIKDVRKIPGYFGVGLAVAGIILLIVSSYVQDSPHWLLLTGLSLSPIGLLVMSLASLPLRRNKPKPSASKK